MTIKEEKGRLKDVRVAYIGDGNNVANSLVESASLTGIDLVLACPEGYEPDKKILETSTSKGGRVKIIKSPYDAAKDADVLYTDVWVSMGQESESEKKMNVFKDFQINRKLLDHAKSNAIVMRCLPAHRGE